MSLSFVFDASNQVLNMFIACFIAPIIFFKICKSARKMAIFSFICALSINALSLLLLGVAPISALNLFVGFPCSFSVLGGLFPEIVPETFIKETCLALFGPKITKSIYWNLFNEYLYTGLFDAATDIKNAISFLIYNEYESQDIIQDCSHSMLSPQIEKNLAVAILFGCTHQIKNENESVKDSKQPSSMHF